MLRRLIGQFVRPVLLANLIAWPVAWWAMRNGLAGFDQSLALSPIYFLGIGGAALALSVLTVFGQSARLAHREAARALGAL